MRVSSVSGVAERPMVVAMVPRARSKTQSAGQRLKMPQARFRCPCGCGYVRYSQLMGNGDRGFGLVNNYAMDCKDCTSKYQFVAMAHGGFQNVYLVKRGVSLPQLHARVSHRWMERFASRLLFSYKADQLVTIVYEYGCANMLISRLSGDCKKICATFRDLYGDAAMVHGRLNGPLLLDCLRYAVSCAYYYQFSNRYPAAIQQCMEYEQALASAVCVSDQAKRALMR